MNLQSITQNLGLLSSLAGQFDTGKATDFINNLKSAPPEDLNSILNLVKPLAGGQLTSVIQTLLAKVDPQTLAQFQQVLGNVDSQQIQSLVTQFAGQNAGNLMSKAKDVLGTFLK